MKKTLYVLLSMITACVFRINVCAETLMQPMMYEIAPYTSDQINLIIMMLCISGGALILLLLLTILQKYKKK